MTVLVDRGSLAIPEIKNIVTEIKIKNIAVILQVNVIGENSCAFRFKVTSTTDAKFEINCCCNKENREKCTIPQSDDLQLCATGSLADADGRRHDYPLNKMPLKTVWFHPLH